MKTFKTSNLWKRFLCGTLSALIIFGGGRSPTVVDAADTNDLDVTINYAGRQVQTWTAPYSGYYYVEAYGAAGGNDGSRGGYGGYVKMYTYLNEGTNLYITCGQKGWAHWSTSTSGGQKLEDNPAYNGGARASNTIGASGVGGGATSIAISNHGELKDFANCKNDVLMVAGGGAGGSLNSSGSGGLVLYTGSSTNYSVMNGADTSLLNGQFALGSPPVNDADGGGGGGGWIGGKSGLDAAGNSAGGGASFVNTSQNCIPIELIPDYNAKDGYVHITSTDYTGYYTISYDYDGGTASNPISYSVTQDDFTLTAPTKEGYTFTGWTGSNGDTPQKDVTIKKGTVENLSFKANWSINYYYLDLNSVVDDNGVSCLPDGCTCDLYINGKLVGEGIQDWWNKLPYGTEYEFKNFKTREGFEFKGAHNDFSALKGIITQKVWVYPWYVTKSLTTTFHRNTSSADTETASQTFTYGVANQKFAANTFVNNGYTFKGWAFAQNAANADYPDNCIVADQWIDSCYPKVDLYAVWSANSYKVTYNANGGTNAPAAQSFLYNSGEKLSTQVPVRTGYKFVGWRSGTTVYNPGDSIPSGTMDLDLKAMWIVNSYQVAFNGNESTNGAMESECFNYDEAKALNKNAYSKDGYSFKNWNTKADGSGTTYSDEQTISKLANGENISASINPIQTFNCKEGMRYDGLEEDNNLTTGIAYKATYTTTGYTSMGFYSQPYENAIANNKLAGKRIVVTFKAKASIPMQLKNVGLENVSIGPISLGTSWNTYYFTGIIPDNWITMSHAIIFYDPSVVGTVYVGDMSVSIVEPVNLYAQWEPVSWTVKYDANGGSGAMADTKHKYMVSVQLNKNTFVRNGYTFNGWVVSRVRNGKTEWLCGKTEGSWIDSWVSGAEWYEKGNIPSNRKLYHFADSQVMYRSTYIDGDVITAHAQWTANTHKNRFWHFVQGFKNAEGNSTNKKAYKVKEDSSVSFTYGQRYTIDESYATQIPNGCYLDSSFGSSWHVGTNGIWEPGDWLNYKMGTTIVQADGSMFFEYDYYPYDYTITYNLNGGTNNNANPSTYTVLYGVTLKNPIRAGYTFTGWYDKNGNKVTGINEGCNATFSSADDLYAKLAKRTTGNRTLTAHWSYNPVSVKVPQILTGDHTGKSQFRVKCDSIVAGNIAVEPDSSFNYMQDKLAVRAAVKRKSSSNIINKNNHSVVYDIITDKPLTAGCWQGSFNIKLTLTKE